MNYTKGPWQVVKGNNGVCDTWQVEVKTPTLHGTIADCGFITAIYADGTKKPKEQHLANARLIAAAPELLEALERVQELLQSAVAADDSHSADELGQAENILSVAINKAKGE
ncbi:MAG: hypothetical protein ACK5PR_01730 [bacterium]